MTIQMLLLSLVMNFKVSISEIHQNEENEEVG
jgi:hypothetical protein